jgi:hypothetical protein
MDRSYWLAFAAYLLPSFPLGYLWHLTVFKRQYERLELFREQVIIPFGIAAMVVQAAIFAWAYPRLFSTARDAWVTSGAQFALVFGLLGWSFMTLPVAAKYRMRSVRSFMLLETAFVIVQYAVVSPLIALAWRDSV